MYKNSDMTLKFQIYNYIYDYYSNEILDMKSIYNSKFIDCCMYD